MVNNKLREGKPHKVVSGTLIAHGQAPFDHKEENELNYFAELRTKSNHDRTCWGVDLERAISESGVQLGDEIVMTQTAV